ncbi:MAG TPA: amino acid permease, partial [Actinobacteria bacterium]|nr:amino acid permease [Actinomycetota bacterium]
KFTEGAWLVVIVVPLLVLMFLRIRAVYDRIGAALQIGKTPPPPRRLRSLVVVPVRGMSLLVEEAVSAALSLGDDVTAVTVCYADPEDDQRDAEFRGQWEQWHPNVPLLTLRTHHRALGPPIVDYLGQLEAEERYHRVVVLIPDVDPQRWWIRLLLNQRGIIIERAIRKGTSNVVVCRLHFRLSAITGQQPGAPAAGSGHPAGSGQDAG